MKYALLIFVAFVSVGSIANTTPPVDMSDTLRTGLERALGVSANDTRRPFSIVVKGGISLGVYESGVNWTILRIMKDLRDASSLAKPELIAAAGASAGAINGFLAGLMWCTDGYTASRAAADTLDNNLIRNAWHQIDLDELLLAKSDAQTPEDIEKNEDKAAFSRELLRAVQRSVDDQIDQRQFRDGCEVAFGLSLTRSKAVTSNSAGIELAQQRLVAPFKIKGDTSQAPSVKLLNLKFPSPWIIGKKPQRPTSGGDAKLLEYYEDLVNFNHQLENRAFLSSVIYLDGVDEGDVIDEPLRPDDVFEAIKASSAFPAAFAAKKLSYCLYSPGRRPAGDERGQQSPCPSDYERRTSYFVDGGIFDNDPLELVRELSELGSTADNRRNIQYIKIDPERRRAAKEFFRFELPRYSLGGDSIEILLWSGKHETATMPEPSRTHGVTALHCRGGKFHGHIPLMLTETAPNSQKYAGVLHTSSENREDSNGGQFIAGADVQMAPDDRLIFFSNLETYRPRCPSSEAQRSSKANQRINEKHRTIGIVEFDPSGLSTQLGFAADSVRSARGYRLYDELQRHLWHDGVYDENFDQPGSRPLMHPSRLTPITGDYLNAFGAFVDESFRDFDYYAGVFDGVYGIAEFICRAMLEPSIDCRGKKAKDVYLQLCAPNANIENKVTVCREESPLANAVMHQLAVLEACGIEKARTLNFDGPPVNDAQAGLCDLKEWAWVDELIPWEEAQGHARVCGELTKDKNLPNGVRICEVLLVSSALFRAEYEVAESKADPFLRFIDYLSVKRNRIVRDKNHQVFGRMLARADRHTATWYYPVAKSVVPKLLHIEDEDADIRRRVYDDSNELSTPIRVSLALAGMASESLLKEPLGWQWNQTSVPSQPNKGWVATAMFSELAVDSRNGGAALYWNPGYRFENGWAIDFRAAPYLRQRFDNQTVEFSEITAFAAYRPKKRFIGSIGIGPTYSYTWSSEGTPKEHNLGASISVGLLADKFRITYGVRSFSKKSDFEGDDVYWHLGINDFPGMFYWGCRGAGHTDNVLKWMCDLF